MVNFKSIADKAKQAVEKRGGTGSLKEDAAELKSIATGKGSLSDKAKAAAAAIKDPGAAREEREAAGRSAGSAEAPTAPTPKQAAGQAKADAAEKAGKKRKRERPDEVGGAK